MGRRTRSTLPLSADLLKPDPPDPTTVSHQITLRKEASKAQYDKRTQAPLRPLPSGYHAYAKPRQSLRGTPWIYGQVIGNPSPWSYTIDTGTTTLRRNRAQLRPAASPQTIPLRFLPLPYVQPSLPATPPPSSSFTPHELNQPPTAASPQPEGHTAQPFTGSPPQQPEQQTSRNLILTLRSKLPDQKG